MSEPLFDKIALIGIGLIGSSLARVIRREGLARQRSPAPKNSASATATRPTPSLRSRMPT
jgi:cyclohexadieny/prephenate dehydrogenase